MRKIILLFAVSLLCIAGCAKKNTALTNKECSDNPYLKRYDCSLTAVQQAAMQGDADAEYALGYMYYYGVDTAQDHSAAYIWINKAAQQGQPLAQQAQRMLQRQSLPGMASAKMQDTPTKVANAKRFHAKPAIAKPSTKSGPIAKKSKSNLNSYDIKKLAKQNPKHYALQLIASPKLSAVRAAQNAYGYSDSYVYSKRLRGQTWYVLVKGNYPTHKAASAAISKLPSRVRAQRPWPKSFASIQREIAAN